MCGATWATARLVELTTHADSAVVLSAVQSLMVLGGADDAQLARVAAHPDGEVVKQVLHEGCAFPSVLVQAVRSGNVAMANALGSGLVMV
jgi:hypothetical protein